MITPDPSLVLTDRDLRTDRPWVRVVVGLATVVAVGAVLATHWAEPVQAALLAVVVLCYGVLTVFDLAEQRLPNGITLPLAAATAVVVPVAGLAGSDEAVILSALGMGVAFAFVLLVARFGMGDVKLAFTVGAIAGWLGRDAIIATMLVGSLTGAVVALILLAVHRSRDLTFGFGPFLALGSVAGMLVGVG